MLNADDFFFVTMHRLALSISTISVLILDNTEYNCLNLKKKMENENLDPTIELNDKQTRICIEVEPGKP